MKNIMKKTVFTVASIFVLNLMMLNSLWAYEQDEPCTPDCFETDWQFDAGGLPFAGQFTVTLSNGTMVNVSYEFVFRYACGSFQDIQVMSFVYDPPNASAAEVYAYIMDDIIKNQIAVTGFAPSPVEMENGETRCDYTWRTVLGGCWADLNVVFSDSGIGINTPNMGGTGTIAIPSIVSYHKSQFYATLPSGILSLPLIFTHKCEADCCFQPIEVCVTNNNGTLSWTKNVQELPGGQVNCDDVYYEYYGHNISCSPRCHWISDLGDYWVNDKITINEEEEKDIVTRLYNQQLEITFNSINEGTMEVNIYDNSANLIISEEKKLGIGEMWMSIYTGYLRSGIYYYNIVFNGEVILTNKFIIVR